MAQTPSHSYLPSGINYNYLTDLSLLVPRAYEKFIQIYPDLASKNYIILREAQGALKYTPNKQFYQWQPMGKNAPSWKGSAITGAAGASVTTTVQAGYYTDAGTLSPPAPGHYYFNDTNGQLYQVASVNRTTPNSHTVVLNQTDSTVATAILATDLLVFYPTVVGEKSGSQSTIAQNDIKVVNYCATIKTTKEFTDWALFERLDIPNSPAGFDHIKPRQMYNEYDLFLAQQELLTMFGKPFNNIAGVQNQHTGVVWNVINNGNADFTSTNVDSAFFDNLRRGIDANGYSDSYDWLMNIELRMKVENFIASTYNAGAIVYKNADAFAGQGATINRNFKAYDVHGITVNFKTYDYFSSANIYGGAPNSGYWNNAGLMIPRGDGIDPDTGLNVPRFSVRWQGQSEQDAPIKVRPTGGWAPTPTDDIEHLLISHVATKGVQMFGLNGYFFQQLQS